MSLLKQVRPPSVQGAVELLGVILPIKVPTGIHEIQPVEICVYSGPICGRNPRKGAPTLIWICHRGWGCLSIALLLAVAWEGRHMGPLIIIVAMPWLFMEYTFYFFIKNRAPSPPFWAQTRPKRLIIPYS